MNNVLLLLLRRLLLIVLMSLPGLSAQAQRWQWRQMTETEVCFTAADAEGNTYVTGRFEGTIAFGSTKLTALADEGDLYIAKIARDGTYEWAVQPTGEKGAVGRDIVADAQGNVYVTGCFKGVMAFGATRLVAEGATDLFVAKLSATGEWRWAARAGGSDEDEGKVLTVDNKGNVYLSGTFINPRAHDWATADEDSVITFGNTNITLECEGKYGVLIAKLSPAGAWEWATQVGGCNLHFAHDIVTDGSGQIYVLVRGVLCDTVMFGDIALARGKHKGFMNCIGKLSPAGRWQWAILSPARWQWAVKADKGQLVSDGSSDHVYLVCNSKRDSLRFGNTLLTRAGKANVLVARLSSAGTWDWATRPAGNGNEYFRGATADHHGNVYLMGEVDAVGAPTDPSAGVTTDDITSEAFMASVSPTGQWTSWTTSENTPPAEALGPPKSPLYVAGIFGSPLTAFTNAPFARPLTGKAAFIACFDKDLTGPAVSTGFRLSPNPAHQTVRLSGVTGPIQLLDGLGRVVRHTVAAPDGGAVLEVAGLAPGLYTVRTESHAQPLVVE